MSPIQTIIKSISISADEIGIVESVRNRLTEIGEIDRRTRPDGPAWIGAFSWLHHRVDELAADLAAAPSLELAEQLHAAIVRLRDAGHSIEPIAASLRHASAGILAQLTPIVTAVFDQADAALEVRRKGSLSSAVQGDTMLVDVTATINARAQQLTKQLAAERESAMAEPLGFLTSHIEPVVAETPAPAPAPPIKSYRGRVKLDKAEPEPPADVLTELADEADDDDEDPLAILTAGT
jgi:hypothetical protein